MTTKTDIVDLNEKVQQSIVDAEACLARCQELQEALKAKNIELVKKLMKEIN